MRKLSDMTEDERAAYRIWKSRLENDMSSPEEQREARQHMEALEWSGTTGPVMAKLGDLEKRIEALESKNSGGSAKMSKKSEADLVAHLLDEVKTAVMSEADAAAKVAVDNYMKGGDF
jgi:hypothetical protein